jgi:hypothetical protein
MGNNKIKHKKNKIVTICPISKNGDITGKLPIQPNKKQIIKKNQITIA